MRWVISGWPTNRPEFWSSLSARAFVGSIPWLSVVRAIQGLKREARGTPVVMSLRS
jgi:hypothetical protein